MLIYLGSYSPKNQNVLSFHCPVSRVPREAALDINTEPSQSEQIVWDDPTAREERAKLADNLQWPGSPSQHSEPLGPAPPPGPQFKDSMTDSELVELGKNMHMKAPETQISGLVCAFFELFKLFFLCSEDNNFCLVHSLNVGTCSCSLIPDTFLRIIIP